MNTMQRETGNVGKRGVFTIPAALRRRFGLEDGSFVIAEETEEGILLRPAVNQSPEVYTDLRTAEFLLTNAVDITDYETARRDVIEMGIDPDTVNHIKTKESSTA